MPSSQTFVGAFNGLQLAVMARDMHPEMRLSSSQDSTIRCCERMLSRSAPYLVKPVVSGELLKLLDPRPTN